MDIVTMGIWTWLARKIKSANVGGWNVRTWQSGRPYYPDQDFKELVKKYQSWVYTCAHINADACAQVPLRLYVAKPGKKTKALFPTKRIPNKRLEYIADSPSCQKYVTMAAELEEVVEHPFLDLISQVNDFTNGFELLEETFLFQDLVGNAYWHVVRPNPNMPPTEIWPLKSQYVRIIPDKARFIARFEFVITESEKHIIKTEDMVHFKYVNPQDALYGLGPLQACVVAADLGFEMNAFETGLLRNRARPDVAIILPPEAGEPGETEQKRVEKAFYKKFRGTNKAGKPIWLYGGADIKPITLTPREMGYLQGRKASVNEVASVFGVPMSKITTDNVNRANAEAGDYAHAKDTVRPRLRKVEQKINEKLLSMYDPRLFCAFDDPVPEDKEFRLKQTESHLKTGYSAPNEERQIDGVDTCSWGEVPILPMGVAPLGSNKPPPLVTEPVKTIRQKAPRKLPPLDHPTNFVNEPFVKVLQEYYRQCAEDVLAGFDRDLQPKGIKKVPEIADDYVAGWVDISKWNGDLENRIRPFLRFTFVNGGERALQAVESERRFDALNPRVLTALESHRVGSIDSINSTLVKHLRKAMAEGIGEGEGVSQIRKRVEREFDWLSKYQAAVVARTETIWAWNEGAVQGYIQSGVVKKKQWLSSGDERSCEDCIDMDGKELGLEIDFFPKGAQSSSGRLTFSYEAISHPPLHPQCRCTVVAILE